MKRTVIERIDYSRSALERFVNETRSETRLAETADLLLEYPTVYVIGDKTAAQYDVYVGETADIYQRTVQHLDADTKIRDDWAMLAASDKAQMYVIGHVYFNKSLTLDVENKLMLYLSGLQHIRKLNNRRSNAQKKYYTQEHFDEVFASIWRGLRRRDKDLFPTERIVKDSALFKASPFHKLTPEQEVAKQTILVKAMDLLSADIESEIILVKGEAGAGKTVLLSSLFYEFFQGADEQDDSFSFQNYDAYMLVNHKEQLTVYEQIAEKLGIQTKTDQRVFKPSSFIRHMRARGGKADVVLVDEAHLLLTQGDQGYSGKNHLSDLLEVSKLVIAVYDKKQVLTTKQYWEGDKFKAIEQKAGPDNTVVLRNQMRMDASPSTVRWVNSIVEQGIIEDLPEDDKRYEVKIFDSPSDLHEAIKKRAGDEEKGLSRLVATYDWKWNPKPPKGGGTWDVDVDGLRLPWNYETKGMLSHQERIDIRGKAWAEQKHTINEVGSTYTIQGFDLNYVGVILGPSVKYRNGRIVSDPLSSWNKRATQRRTLESGEKKSVAEDLLRNELNVLLTRGVHGLYIYAVDEELRKALRASVGGRSD